LWKSVKIRRGLTSASSNFDLSVADPRGAVPDWAGPVPKTLRPGKAAVVAIADQPVITGWIDDVEVNGDARAHDLRLTGRSRTCDLVDCSAILAGQAGNKAGKADRGLFAKGGPVDARVNGRVAVVPAPAVVPASQFKGRRLEQIAADLAAPFNVAVVATCDTGEPFDDFQLEQGETVHAAIERLSRLRGVTVGDDPAGRLVLARPGDGPFLGTLKRGDNIKRGGGKFAFKDRFSDYITKGQTSGSDERYGAAVAGGSGNAHDPAVTRYRPLIVMAEGKADAARCADRAAWEAAHRAGKSLTLNYDVYGWWAPSGQLWAEGGRVEVDDPWLDLAMEVLIGEVHFSIDRDGGTITTLSLSPKEAFEPDPFRATKIARSSGGGPKPKKKAGLWDVVAAAQED